jgi:hypothetical protein
VTAAHIDRDSTSSATELFATHLNQTMDRPLAADAEDHDELISELLAEHAYWRIDRILDTRFTGSALADHHRDDVRAEILLRLVVRLRRFLREPAEDVRDLPSYISVVAFNTFDDFIRRRYPLRAKLKNRIRYALGHSANLAIWECASGTLCGMRDWNGRRAAVDARHVSTLTNTTDVRAALEELFAASGGPLKLDTAVSLIAESFLPQQETRAVGVDDVAAPSQTLPGDQLESRQYLAEVWAEIRALPLKQRIALILSARDSSGESITRYLPLTGIASIRDIARSLMLDARTFTGLWDELPLDDLRIADMLHASRQQVINLRRAARDRLTRRLRRDNGRGGSER